MKRSMFDAAQDKKAAVKDAESKGLLADSMAVRLALVNRIAAGEITPEEGQAELRRIKQNARRNGLKTRDEVFRNG